MKSVLMVVFSLSLNKSPGNERVINFINQLRYYGWEPVVLTHDSGSDSLDELSSQLPEDIDIIRTGLDMSGLPHIFESLPKSLFSLLKSDSFKFWEFLSQRKASRIVKNGGADMVYTVSPPYSSHHIGLRLKKKHPNLPWVADLGSTGSLGRNFEKNLLTRIRENADFIVPADSEVGAQELSELFEKACRTNAAKRMENV